MIPEKEAADAGLAEQQTPIQRTNADPHTGPGGVRGARVTGARFRCLPTLPTKCWWKRKVLFKCQSPERGHSCHPAHLHVWVPAAALIRRRERERTTQTKGGQARPFLKDLQAGW